MEQVTFRYSDRDFVAYLMTIGMKIKDIEVKLDKRTSKLKAFVHIEGEKENLIQLYKDYQEKEIAVNLHKLAINKIKINRLIQAEIANYKAIKIS